MNAREPSASEKHQRKVNVQAIWQRISTFATVFGLFVTVLILLFSVVSVFRPDPALALLRRIEQAVATSESDIGAEKLCPTQQAATPVPCEPLEVTREVTVLVTVIGVADSQQATMEAVRSALLTQTAEADDDGAPAVAPTESSPQITPAASIFFADNFESGVTEGWDIQGNNFGMVDGQFASLGWLTAYVGDVTWSDYAVEFDLESLIWSDFNFGLRVQIRRKDDANYYEWQLNSINSCKFRWLVVVNGLETEIIGSEVRLGSSQNCPGRYRIEAQGDTFRTIKDGNQELMFVNSVFTEGGVGLISTNDRTEFMMDNFQVLPLP